MDFVLLHTVNTLVLMPTLVNHEWISRENAIRWMEWTGRLHLLHYVAETAPPLDTTELDKKSSTLSWDSVFDHANNHPTDDGHLVKNIRALAWAEQFTSQKYDSTKDTMRPRTWLKLANLGEVCFYHIWSHANVTLSQPHGSLRCENVGRQMASLFLSLNGMAQWTLLVDDDNFAVLDIVALNETQDMHRRDE